MTIKLPDGVKRKASGQFVVDRAYIRGQALEAVLTFVAPFTGVYRAVAGISAIGPVIGTKQSSGFSKPYAKARAKRKAKPAPIGRP